MIAVEGRRMEASKQPAGWKKWHHWLLWWEIDPAELERQAEGHATLKMAESARGRGFLLAVLSGVLNAAVGAWTATVAVGNGWPDGSPFRVERRRKGIA